MPNTSIWHAKVINTLIHSDVTKEKECKACKTLHSLYTFFTLYTFTE